MSTKVLDGKAKPLGNYPHIKRVGDFLLVSGTSSRRLDNTHVGADQDEHGNWQLDIRKQTAATLDNIIGYLEAMDATKDDIVDITSFLVDMKDFKGYNEVYGEYFDHSGPARTTVAVHQLPHPNIVIEIKAMAYKPLA